MFSIQEQLYATAKLEKTILTPTGPVRVPGILQPQLKRTNRAKYIRPDKAKHYAVCTTMLRQCYRQLLYLNEKFRIYEMLQIILK
jgi:hypothetical protein